MSRRVDDVHKDGPVAADGPSFPRGPVAPHILFVVVQDIRRLAARELALELSEEILLVVAGVPYHRLDRNWFGSANHVDLHV
jgi:hypothetical protein